MMIFARMVFGVLRTGPGMLVGGVLVLWLALSAGEWRGAHSRSREVGLLRGTLTAMQQAVEQDRAQNTALRQRDAERVQKLEIVKSKLEVTYHDTLERLDHLARDDRCHAHILGVGRVRLLNTFKPARSGFRRSLH